MVTPRARSMLWARSAWRSEELESDAIGISEAHTRAIGCVLDPTVDDAKFVNSAGPGLQLGSVGATESDMIETEPMLAELLGGGLGLVAGPARKEPAPAAPRAGEDPAGL